MTLRATRARSASRSDSRPQSRVGQQDLARSPPHYGPATAPTRSSRDTACMRWSNTSAQAPPQPTTSRWSPKWPLLPETSRPNSPATESLSPTDADSRPPSRGECPSPVQSAEGANQDAPALSPVLAFLCSRHSPCRQRLNSPSARMSLPLKVAGFQMTPSGRIWVTPKVNQ